MWGNQVNWENNSGVSYNNNDSVNFKGHYLIISRPIEVYGKKITQKSLNWWIRSTSPADFIVALKTQQGKLRNSSEVKKMFKFD